MTIGEPFAGVITTLAPGMAAPDGSVTCPRNAPFASCADENAAHAMTENSINVKRRHFSNFIIIFPFH